MTDELAFESRLLVDTARAGLGPDEVAARRMRARVAAAIAGGAIGIAAAHVASAATSSATAVAGTAAAGTAAAGTAAAGTAAAGAIGVKLALAAISIATAAGIGAGTYAVVARNAEPAAIARPHRDEPAPRTSSAPPPIVVREAPAPAIVTAPPPAPVAPAPAPIAPVLARTAAPHIAAPVAPPPPPVAPPPPPSLARETQLLGEAQSALAEGRFADAIAAVARYDAETSARGQLAEDAAAIDVEARCKLHDPSASDALDVFTVRWPHSHERARLAAECGR